MAEQNASGELLNLTAEIVSAHVSHNAVAQGDLPRLIRDVYSCLAGLGNASVEAPAVERREPAVSVKKSVTPDYLICLEDGKKMKMLKRHLNTSYGMTPEQYREKWNLPSDYPMVAPNYAERRSSLAKQFGLGTIPRKAGAEPTARAA